jgi:hypothetical protein
MRMRSKDRFSPFTRAEMLINGARAQAREDCSSSQFVRNESDAVIRFGSRYPYYHLKLCLFLSFHHRRSFRWSSFAKRSNMIEETQQAISEHEKNENRNKS